MCGVGQLVFESIRMEYRDRSSVLGHTDRLENDLGGVRKYI